MKLTSILDALAKAGATSDMLIAAVRAYEIDVNEKESISRENARQRSIRYRNKIKSIENKDHVTVTPVILRDTRDVPPPNGSDGFPHPSLTSLTTPSKINPKGFTKGTPNEPEGFSEFWEYFPRQRRGNRNKALRAYVQACARASPAEILTGLNSYISSDEVASGMAKGAQAWLNDDRWTNNYKIRAVTNGTHNKTKPRTNLNNFLEGLYLAGTGHRADQQSGGVEHSAGGEQADGGDKLAASGVATTEGYAETFDG